MQKSRTFYDSASYSTPPIQDGRLVFAYELRLGSQEETVPRLAYHLQTTKLRPILVIQNLSFSIALRLLSHSQHQVCLKYALYIGCYQVFCDHVDFAMLRMFLSFQKSLWTRGNHTPRWTNKFAKVMQENSSGALNEQISAYNDQQRDVGRLIFCVLRYKCQFKRLTF